MIRTNVIKVLAIYNMSVKELKSAVKHRRYNKQVLKDANMLNNLLSKEVYAGDRKIFKNVSGWLWSGNHQYEKIENHPIHKLNLNSIQC